MILRIYQRIECISTDILNISNLVTILNNIGGSMPKDLHSYVIDIIDLIISSHGMFKQALLKYEKEKSSVIKTIHKIVECEKLLMNNTSDHFSVYILLQIKTI